MLRGWLCLLVLGILAGCDDSAGDKLEDRMDSLGKKADSTVERLWDSTRQAGKEMKERIRNRMEEKDSSGN